MTTVKDILKNKQHQIFSVKSTDAVTLALEIMKEHRIRSILVIDANQLKGIISLGDCAIKVTLAKKDPDVILAADIMTEHPLIVGEEYSSEQCMSIMVAKKVRHLPVVNQQQVIGVISIGDLVGDIIKDQTNQISFLETYMKEHGLDSKGNSHFSFLG
ncbi:CBS domain-containing protein [Polynucleobacter sp. CS-Odin-A6]|uniref:CBS domain-containing protein n=1 Tax=Polynucleobacter sp. CS-Odin-A6 TaxID=2689106 RepID=UPI001C0B18A0|nr:CBS domain-containing protein [Polynucleobacter sp. CS-Odin-A6]MBU3621028.1 CBS domain-containing protein [Polynucleobacter sp. CS-Odin-A6]